ncbi:MAG TPA: hypothetical protein PLO61_08260 [Fimbriimonadaceae bacterium]|nr:hypothetical protein [Fimbriimonadaceae bacterium]HRJ33464.1 hypothetical protein [Fimbriimonadaceae bacterium]
MAGRENNFWHKLHSITGIIPIGYYLIQHLALNSFTIAGEDKFNGVIAFFEGLPFHVLLVLQIFVLLIPILFHSIYGLFITSRAEMNYSGKYRWSENLMFNWQRWTGIILFIGIIVHVATTSINSKINGVEVIQYAAWQEKLTSYFYLPLVLYMIFVAAACYHLSYGIWNFCIRWGITVSDKAQAGIKKFSAGTFVLLVLMGWGALFGFLIHKPKGAAPEVAPPAVSASYAPESR